MRIGLRWECGILPRVKFQFVSRINIKLTGCLNHLVAVLTRILRDYSCSSLRINNVEE